MDILHTVATTWDTPQVIATGWIRGKDGGCDGGKVASLGEDAKAKVGIGGGLGWF